MTNTQLWARVAEQYELNLTRARAAKILTLASLALSFTCSAQVLPDTVGVHLMSHHFSAPASGQKPWVDNNPGVYGIWSGAARGSDVVVGTYANSVGRQSVYAAVAVDTVSAGPVTVGVLAGAVTGYQREVSPLLAASVRVAVSRAALRLTVTPKPPKGSAVAHLSAEWRF